MYYRLFSNCIPVKGYERAIICDLQKGVIHLITIDLYEILSKYKVLKIDFLVKKFGEHNRPILMQYLNFLIDYDLVHCNTNRYFLNRFPKLSLNWEQPNLISNLIVDMNQSVDLDRLSQMIIECSEILLCQNLQIRVFDYDTQIYNPYTLLNRCLILLNDSLYRNIEIIIPYKNHYSFKYLKMLIAEHIRITNIILYSVPKDKMDGIENQAELLKLTNQKIIGLNSCGIVSFKYFSSNIKLFTEAQKHNTCLNRKISIDVNGEIKNCPSMAKSYGNIKDTTLAEAIEKPGFKDMWFINKDQIAVCKDCEFRYICTDCRAYIENPEDIYSKPLKCGYNPYTAEWEEWSTNPLKQKAIEYYGMQELVKKDTP